MRQSQTEGLGSRLPPAKRQYPVQGQDLINCNAQAQQRNAEPKQSCGRKLDAGDARAFFRQEIERHAQEQGKEHLRRAVML